MLIKIAIIDPRESYLARLVEAFSSGYADRLEVVAFSSMESFDEFVRGSHIDVMLVGSDLASEELTGKRGSTLVYLVDDKSIESMYGHRAICRFQKTDLIYRGILDACSDRFGHVTSRRKVVENVNVISFFPASGGAGASSMAAACALGAAKRGMRAFYLNLELLGTASAYFSAPGYSGLDDVLLAIEAKKENVGVRLQSAVKRSSDGVSFLDSCSSAFDVAELTADHLERLLREIAMSDTYDVIILDLDSLQSKLSLAALDLSSRAVFVSNGTMVSNMKFERLYQMLQAMGRSGLVGNLGKVVLAYNNFSSKTGRQLLGDVVPVAGGLSRVVDASGSALHGKQLIEALSVKPLFNVLLALGMQESG